MPNSPTGNVSAPNESVQTQTLSSPLASAPPIGASVRLEVFVQDLDAFVDFYTRVLGFAMSTDQRATATSYRVVKRDTVRIGAALPWAPVEPESRTVPNGVEIVLEVDDIDADCQRVVDNGWPLAEDKKKRPWGLTNFRLHDPDGYYIRVTNR